MGGEYVTIKITRETREMLKELGRKGETYDDVIKRLIENWRKIEGGK